MSLITVTWSHRDRLLQADQLIDTTATSIGPEIGTTYTARFYLNGVLTQTIAGVAINQATWAPGAAGVVRVEVDAVRDGLVSWQALSHSFDYLLPPFSITSLWAAGEPGAWYDPSDLASQFQDAAGTIPVTAVEQPAGKILDKSGRGNHLAQPAASYQLVFSAAVNRLIKTEALTDPAWAFWGAATITAGVADPDGGAAAFQLDMPANYTGTYQALANLSGVYHKATVYLRADAAGTIRLLDGNGGSYDSAVTVTTAWQRVDVPAAAKTGTTPIQYGIYRDPGQLARVYVYHPQLETGTVATRYQRVNTAADYDTIDFPKYWKCDGVEDYESATTGGGATSGVFFCAAIKPRNPGTLRMLWSDAGTNTGWQVRINAADQLEFVAGNGTAYVTVTTTTTLAAGAAVVVSAWHDGTNICVQVNQGAVVSTAFAAAAAGTAGYTVGKDNAAAASFFGGGIYPIVYRTGTPLTATQITNAQAWVAQQAGVIL